MRCLLLALLLGAAAVTAIDVMETCSNTPMPGGWSYVSLSDIDNLETVAPLVKSAVNEFVTANTALQCPGEVDLDVDYICSQVVSAATNYRVILTADCDDSDDAQDKVALFLEALINVPSSGEPTFNVSQITSGCPQLSDDELVCFIDAHRVECDTIDDDAGPGIYCSVTTPHSEGEEYKFTCPVKASGNTYTVDCKDETLAALPSWLAGNLTEAFDTWSSLAVSNFNNGVWENDGRDDMDRDDGTGNDNDRDGDK